MDTSLSTPHGERHAARDGHQVRSNVDGNAKVLDTAPPHTYVVLCAYGDSVRSTSCVTVVRVREWEPRTKCRLRTCCSRRPRHAAKPPRGCTSSVIFTERSVTAA